MVKEFISQLPPDKLSPFAKHPYQVREDAAMDELVESVRTYGILSPLLARPKGEGYELVSGHRRRLAAQKLGLPTVPVLVREMTDDEAVILMVDSNLQRENLLPSEKAFAYKMKLEAMKQQGRRNDLTSGQVEPKLENETLEIYPLESEIDENGRVIIKQKSGKKGIRSNELLARQVGESVNQIKRYIRLTHLIPKILDMVDEEKLALTSAVEISFLTEEEQYELHAVMEIEQSIPNLSQANRLKRMSQQNLLDMDSIYEIMEEVKPNQREQVKIPLDRVGKYFPADYTPLQQIELIEKLLRGWAKQNKNISR